MSEAAEAYSAGTEVRIDEQRIIAGDLLNEIPQAVGWRLIVQPVPVEEVSKGGILLPSQAQKANELLTYVGKVLSMGPLCYQHAKFEGCEPWCSVGDYVVFGQYTGQKLKFELPDESKVDLVVLNDDEVRGVTKRPERLRAYV